MRWYPFAIVVVVVFSAGVLHAQKLRSEEATAQALPAAWREVKHLPEGFPADYRPPISAKVPDGRGGVIDLSRAPSPDDIANLRRRAQRGELFDYYYLPGHDRYGKGPGLTGDEFLDDIRNDRFPKDCKHSNFIYGFYVENVRRYYILYRVTGDAHYVEQIARYADAAQWLLEHRPQQFLPEGRRNDPLPKPMKAIPHEPAALSNFFPHVNAARLLLEEAKKHNAGPDDPRVIRAKAFLLTAVRWMASKVEGPFPQTFGRSRGKKRPPSFTPGKTTKMLVEQHRLPPRAAFTIEYTPWNQTFFYYITLAAAAEALDDLGDIEKTEKYREQADLYKRVCRAAMILFQTESDCVIKDGTPYLFHLHTPLRDGSHQYRLGHPVFGAEDLAHSKSGALNLPYLWEAGPDYGCTSAIVAGYANAMLHTLNDPTAQKKGKDQPWPRSHLDSPWYLAATERKRGPTRRLAEGYYTMLAFAPDLLAANRRYTRNDTGRGNLSELLFLYAGTIYREARERR